MGRLDVICWLDKTKMNHTDKMTRSRDKNRIIYIFQFMIVSAFLIMVASAFFLLYGCIKENSVVVNWMLVAFCFMLLFSLISSTIEVETWLYGLVSQRFTQFTTCDFIELTFYILIYAVGIATFIFSLFFL